MKIKLQTTTMIQVIHGFTSLCYKAAIIFSLHGVAKYIISWFISLTFCFITDSSFLKFNKIIDQNRLNKYSILVSKDNEDIKVRLPIESNAIKLLVWSYYKNYLNKTIDILKPKSDNWYTEWKNTQNQVNEGKEVHLKEYRIAL